MKLYILLAAVFLLTVSAENCNKKKQYTHTPFKGRLEIKGLCMNYTIKILEGDIDTSKVATQWIDKTTGKNYTNVFSLGSRCNFPDSIKESDEFYFWRDNAPNRSCMTCMAYYPTPPKAMVIKVIKK